jgi:beta-glucanase (GH16 family)
MTRARPSHLLGCLALGLAVLGSPAVAHAPDAQQPAAIAGQGYRLVKDWSFGDSVRDLKQLREQFHTRFIYDGGKLDTLNDEWQRYRDNDNHEFSDGGVALVARVPRELKNGQIESGMLRSRWSFEFGYVEGRMKVPAGRGLWSAFWLNPQDQVWPPEIDILEIVDNGRDTTKSSFHFLHSADVKGRPAQVSLLDKFGAYRPGTDFAEGFHNFAVLWEPGRVRHYVDGTLVVDRPFDWTHKGGAGAGPAHVLVNLAVGGQWPGPPLRLEDFPARLEIDYIRVWQK